MMVNKYLGALLLLFFLSGCYDDKGNYDYHDVNQIALKLMPEGNGDTETEYVFKQPPVDTLRYTLSPEIAQTLALNESKLTFKWKISKTEQKSSDKAVKRDTFTAYTRDFEFKFAPNVQTRISCMFCMTDESTGTSYYKQITLNTRIPYLESWLVLHGESDNRRIGAIEYNNGQGELTTSDIYYDLYKRHRFNNIDRLHYSAVYGNPSDTPERLFLFSQDSCFCLHPSFFAPYGDIHNMMPPGSTKLYSFQAVSGSPVQNYVMMADQSGRVYHNGTWGYFYQAKIGSTPEIQVSALYASAYATIWDEVAKKFYYYSLSDNWYNPRPNGRDADNYDQELTAFPNDLIETSENTKLIWLGRTTKDIENGCSALMKEGNQYALYHIGYGSKKKSDEFVNIERQALVNDAFDENSLFATSVEFADQLFYVSDNILYHFNTVSGESKELYSVADGAKITQIQFRNFDRTPMIENTGTFILGLAVESAAGKGELHEVYLNHAGDIDKTAVFTGFDKIKDMCFTVLSRKL